MASPSIPNTVLFTALTLLSITQRTLAAAVASPATATPSTTSTGSFPTITDTENTGAIDGGTSSTHDTTQAGADGSTSGEFQLSTGAIVGICVPISIVIIIIGKFSSPPIILCHVQVN